MKKISLVLVIIFAFILSNNVNAQESTSVNNIESIKRAIETCDVDNIPDKISNTVLKKITLQALEEEWGKSTNNQNDSERIDIVDGSYRKIDNGQVKWNYTYWVTTTDPNLVKVYLYVYTTTNNNSKIVITPDYKYNSKTISKAKFFKNNRVIDWGW